jgi:hypothetical protein
VGKPRKGESTELSRLGATVLEGYTAWREKWPMIAWVRRLDVKGRRTWRKEGRHVSSLQRLVGKPLDRLIKALDKAGAHGVAHGLDMAFIDLDIFTNNVDHHVSLPGFKENVFRDWAKIEWGHCRGGFDPHQCGYDGPIPVRGQEVADTFLQALLFCRDNKEAIEARALTERHKDKRTKGRRRQAAKVRAVSQKRTDEYRCALNEYREKHAPSVQKKKALRDVATEKKIKPGALRALLGRYPPKQ